VAGDWASRAGVRKAATIAKIRTKQAETMRWRAIGGQDEFTV